MSGSGRYRGRDVGFELSTALMMYFTFLSFSSRWSLSTMVCNSWAVFPFPLPVPDEAEDFCPVAVNWPPLDLCCGRGESLMVALLTASLTVDSSSSTISLDLVRPATVLRSSAISWKQDVYNTALNIYSIGDPQLLSLHLFGQKWCHPIDQNTIIIIPYSRKIWRGIKFGGLADCLRNHQIKTCQNFLLVYIYVWWSRTEQPNLNPPIPFVMAIWDPTAKFNSHQYFRLYGIMGLCCTEKYSKLWCSWIEDTVFNQNVSTIFILI